MVYHCHRHIWWHPWLFGENVTKDKAKDTAFTVSGEMTWVRKQGRLEATAMTMKEVMYWLVEAATKRQGTIRARG